MSFSKLKKRENFHYLKKSGSHLWNAMITPCLCTEDVKSSAHSGTVQCGKPMFTYLGEDFISVWSVACTCIPQAPSMSPREKLFIYLFIGLRAAKKKTSLEERKLALGRSI